MSLASFSNGIRQRILLSSFIVLILFALTSAYSLQQFSASTDSVYRLESVSSQAAVMMEIGADLAELRLDILHFSNVNHDSAFNRIGDSLFRLEQDLLSVQGSVSDEERSSIIEQMLEIYSNYAGNIDSMRESRELERELREKQIPLMSQAILKRVRAEQVRATDDGNAQLLGCIQQIENSLLKAEVRMIAYQIYRKHESEIRALGFLAEAVNEVDSALVEVSMSRETEASLSKLREDISNYNTAFRQAVQAMRGSLFLVNIVMAGEIEEFSILAAQLRDSTLSFQNALTLSVNEELDDARLTTTTVTLGAILLGILLSVSLSQSILLPIKEISLVFQRLANGDVKGTIPGLERKDEIGALAKSATVFKDVSVRTTLLLDESKQLTSALRVREKELQNKTEALEKSIDQLNNFAYVASHDLKSPLRAIDNLAQWVVEDCADKLPEESASHLKLLQQRIGLMESLLDDLLLYSRVGQVEEQLELVSLPALIDEVKMLSDIPKNFEIHCPQTDIKLTTPLVSLRQVFLNLFSNAFKYGISDDAVLTVDWHEGDEDFITFSVADNGPGIDPKYHGKIFEMFQTLSGRDAQGGSGMGLAIVRKVIEGVGGTIRVESEEGKGAKFIFTWPKDCAKIIGTEE